MKNKYADEQWLRDFLKRYNDKLSLTKQPISLSRSFAFNKETVRIVYYKNANVLRDLKYKKKKLVLSIS